MEWSIKFEQKVFLLWRIIKLIKFCKLLKKHLVFIALKNDYVVEIVSTKYTYFIYQFDTRIHTLFYVNKKNNS